MLRWLQDAASAADLQVRAMAMRKWQSANLTGRRGDDIGVAIAEIDDRYEFLDGRLTPAPPRWPRYDRAGRDP